ncbi:MAG: TatD family hydrolase [Dehalococcoidales bacterium]|nr:TatD family hydrolase [Dehalococcoidales bacterium]
MILYREMNRIIDTHTHLDEVENLGEAIAQAKEAGVAAIIAVGSDIASNVKTLEIAKKYPGFVYAALGWHPWYIKESDIEASLEFIRANMDKAVGIGEVGLDYHKRVRVVADKDLQKRALRELLKIAEVSDKPALIHSRYAWRDAYDMVREAGLNKAVFHWYTGTTSVLRDIIDSGYYISVTPAVEYHEEHRRAVKETPLEQLLLETDSPVVYARGRAGEFKSSPADAVRSLKGAAELNRLSEAEVAARTTENAGRLFGIISQKKS